METPRDQCMKEGCPGCKHCADRPSINFRAIECEGCGATLNGNNHELVRAHQEKCVEYMELVRQQAKQAANRPEPNEETLKERYKIFIDDLPGSEGLEEFENTIRVPIELWDALCSKIEDMNEAIDEAPVLYSGGGTAFFRKECGEDTHICLGFGIQPVEEPDSWEKLGKELAETSTYNLQDLMRRARKLKEKKDDK